MVARRNNRKTRKARNIVIIVIVIFGGLILATGSLHIKNLNASANTDLEEVNNFIEIKEESKVELETLNAEGTKSVLFFSSSWCSSCTYTSSVLKEESSKYPNIMFYEIDLDSNRALANEYNVNFVSGLVLIESGTSKIVTEMESNFLRDSLSLFNKSGLYAI